MIQTASSYDTNQKILTKKKKKEKLFPKFQLILNFCLRVMHALTLLNKFLDMRISAKNGSNFIK